MAIFCHEGQPRSGKSYEAAVYVILTAIKKKRKVWAYIEGLNHKKFAELAEITVDECQELLTEIKEEDVLNIPKLCYEQGWKDGWVVIDEVQDFFPAGRKQLDKTTTKFITRHGHEGLDVLIMGQSLSDVNKLWKQRTQQKTQFMKQDSVGKGDSYLWTVFRAKLDANGNPKFHKISSGSKKYDSKYFGLYKSHSEGTENKDNHTDSRANVFNTPLFRNVLPSVVVAVFCAIYFLADFFTTPPEVKKIKTQKSIQTKQPAPKKIESKKQDASKKRSEVELAKLKKKNDELVKELELLKNPPEYIDNLISKNRPRLQMLLYTGEKVIGYVEFLDTSFRAKERLSLEQLKSMGWDYTLKDDYLIISKNDKSHIVTSWPIEPFAKQSNHTISKLNGKNNKRLIAKNTKNKTNQYFIMKQVEK